MSNDAHIDQIFKDGVGEKKFSNRDAMWEKMDASLNKAEKKRKRIIALIILFVSLSIAGYFISGNSHTPQPELASTKTTFNTTDNTISKPKKEFADVGTTAPKDKVTAGVSAITEPAPVATARLDLVKTQKNNFRLPKRANFTVSTSNAEESNLDIETASKFTTAFLTEKLVVDPELLPLQHAPAVPVANIVAIHQPSVKPSLAIPKKQPEKIKKISIEAVAGGDALRMNRQAGYYAGIRISRSLDKETAISFGINYASHTVNDKYRLTSKPVEQWEADIKIQDIHTLRFPVYFQRQMGNSKFAVMAGLVPTYVLEATVYNVPNSFSGNPNQFRKFTLSDVNRLNILFGTGIKYSPFKRIAFELSGSYGFTSLVKDSYRNKSRVNDNFKSLQAGVVLMLR